MTQQYFQPGPQRAAKVADLFAAVAPRYDLINDLQSLGLHRRWKRALVNLARVQPGDRALDVCCGTGDLALALARAGADVTGLDFSPAMLAIARRRAAGAAFREGDALQLPFADNSFDIVTVGYGLRNLADLERGLAEMRRVAKSGGRLLALDFGQPENPLWRGVYFGYLRWCVPALGRIFCRNAAAYAYILPSLQAYPGQTGLAALLEKIGCADVKTINFLGGAMSLTFARKAG